MLEATHYTEEVERLMADNIIVALASELPTDLPLDSYEFMCACRDEYHRRGGTQADSIGGPSRAVAALVQQRQAQG